MNIKSWIKYFIYMLLILIMLFWGLHVATDIVNKSSSTSGYKEPHFYYFIVILFKMVIGLLLGLEHLVCEIRKKGKWKINLPKIVLMGIPSLYFSFFFAMYPLGKPVSPNNILLPLIKVMQYPSSDTMLTILQLIFGYIIITSFYRNNKNA